MNDIDVLDDINWKNRRNLKVEYYVLFVENF